MWLFVLIMIYIVFFPMFFVNQKQDNKSFLKKSYVLCSFMLLVIVSGFRGLDVGTDTWMYVAAYKKMNTFSNALKMYSNRFEIGYRLYNAVIHKISTDPHVLLIITTIVTLLLLYIFFYKKSKYPHISIILFVVYMYYCGSMCLMRQYLAIAIGCIAVLFLEKGKMVKFVMLVLIASLIHSSAIVLLVLLPLSRMRINSVNKVKLFIISMIVILGFNILIVQLIKIFPQYSGYLTSDKYYLQNRLGSILKAGLYGMFFGVINYYYSKNEDVCRINRIGYMCSLIAFCISVVSIQGAILARMGTYFSIISCVTLPNIIGGITMARDRKFVTYTIIAVGIAYYLIILLYRPYWSGVIPYTFWY